MYGAAAPAGSDVSVGSALRNLDRISRDIGAKASELHEVNMEIEPLEAWWEEYLGDFEAALLASDRRMPSEKTRDRQCRRQLLRDETPLGQGTYADHARYYFQLQAKRARLKERIANLKAEADAQRSVLSALKVELEATST